MLNYHFAMCLHFCLQGRWMDCCRDICWYRWPCLSLLWLRFEAKRYSDVCGSCNDDVIKWKNFRVTGPLCGEFTGRRWIPRQRPVTRSFDVFFDLRLNKQLGKQSWGWWFETPSGPLWRHRNGPQDVMSYVHVHVLLVDVTDVLSRWTLMPSHLQHNGLMGQTEYL